MVRTLNKKEENRHHDRDDLDCYGLRDIESLFGEIDDYYKPILVESSFRGNYKYYESRGSKDKNLPVEENLKTIKPYLRDLINDHKTPKSGEWKIQLNVHVIFICSKGTGEIRNINIFSDEEDTIQGNEANDIIVNLFESVLNNYHEEEPIMRGASDFLFESVEILNYKLHKIKLKRGGSYIISPKWIRNKEITINSKNEGDSNCFQYAITIALNHQVIGNDPQIISKVRPFISKYNWEGIDFPSGLKDCKNLEENN